MYNPKIPKNLRYNFLTPNAVYALLKLPLLRVLYQAEKILYISWVVLLFKNNRLWNAGILR